MDPDLFFVAGLAMAVLAIPAIFSALLDGRAPRLPAYLFIIGGLMIGYAVQQRPMAYGFDTIPDVVVRVIGRYTS
ncbi:hypothetical protein AB3Y40_18370 [Yoonia sp. R2331]|uniref:hypothetical protein n=1 Tax=Yoonia sp. R2331 TaxID=3237238 RepID=UPI0034E48EE8